MPPGGHRLSFTGAGEWSSDLAEQAEEYLQGTGRPARLFRKTKVLYDGDVLSIHPHALKHGVDPGDIHAAFESGFDGAAAQDDDPPRWLMVGFDSAGRMIELVVVELEDGGYLAIHAMRARKASIRQIRNAREG